MWKTLLWVQDRSPRGRTIHTSTFKPLLGWAVGHIHFPKPESVGQGSTLSCTATRECICLLNSNSLPQRSSLLTATWPDGLEDHSRGAGPKRPEFKIHSRLGYTRLSPNKHRDGGSSKPFAQSDAAPALPRVQTLSVMVASGLEPQDS